MYKLAYYLLICYLVIACLSPVMVSANEMHKPSLLSENLDSRLNKQSFLLIGEAKFSILFWDIYQSRLLTSTGKYPIDNNKEELLFEVSYLRDILSKELIEQTIEQWQHLGLAPEKYQDYLVELQKIWPDIKNGDSLTLYLHQGRSVFYLNQRYIGEISAPDFSDSFLAIWLSENTSQPNLRLKLLGNIDNE